MTPLIRLDSAFSCDFPISPRDLLDFLSGALDRCRRASLTCCLAPARLVATIPGLSRAALSHRHGGTPPPAPLSVLVHGWWVHLPPPETGTFRFCTCARPCSPAALRASFRHALSLPLHHLPPQPLCLPLPAARTASSPAACMASSPAVYKASSPTARTASPLALLILCHVTSPTNVPLAPRHSAPVRQPSLLQHSPPAS